MGTVEVALIGSLVCIWILLPLIALLVMVWMLARLQDRLRSLEAEMRRVRDELSSRASTQEDTEAETSCGEGNVPLPGECGELRFGSRVV